MGTKRSLLTDGDGVPLSIAVSGANTHDIKLLEETIDELIITPTKKVEQNLCADQAYDSADVRRNIRKRGYQDHIRARREEKLAKMKRNQGPTMAYGACPLLASPRSSAFYSMGKEIKKLRSLAALRMCHGGI